MIRWATAISILLCSAFAFAEPSHFFVGAAGQWQTVGMHLFPEPVYANPFLDSEDESPFYDHWTGFGEQIEGGIAHSFWSVGLGFSHLASARNESHSSAPGNIYSKWERTERLTNDRLLLGLRLRASDHDPNPLKPTIGIGCSWGWMTWTSDYRDLLLYNGQIQWDVSDHAVRHTKGSLGLALELGMTVRMQRDLFLSCLGRIDAYDMNLDKDYHAGWQHVIPTFDGAWIAALQLGLQYHFRAKSGGDQ
jgi:hypothetical protein